MALCHEPRSGNRGADAFDQFEPQVRQITKAEVHLRGISYVGADSEVSRHIDYDFGPLTLNT